MKLKRTTEREVFERKQASRDADARLVASGKRTWAEMNRANSLAAPIISSYRMRKKLGFP